MASSISPSTQLVWHCPEPGKPGPKGTRIDQKGQVGPTCAFYAAQLVRGNDRLKYSTDLDRFLDRQREKAASSYRKAFTKDIDLSLKYHALNEGLIARFKDGELKKNGVSKNAAQTYLKSWGFFSKTILFGWRKKNKEQLKTLLINFTAHEMPNEKLIDFIKDTSDGLIEQSIINFFNSVRVPILSVERTIQHLFPQSSLNRHYYASCQQHVLVNYINQHVYHFKLALWTPFDTIHSLAREIFLHGQLSVGMHLEESYYQGSGTLLAKQVNGRSIYSRTSENRRYDTTNPWRHVVVVIGADPLDGSVYYLDPIDGSKANDPSSQKVYTMHYEIFKTSTLDIFARDPIDEYGNRRNDFAYYFEGNCKLVHFPDNDEDDDGVEPAKKVTISVDSFFESEPEENEEETVYDVDTFLASVHQDVPKVLYSADEPLPLEEYDGSEPVVYV